MTEPQPQWMSEPDFQLFYFLIQKANVLLPQCIFRSATSEQLSRLEPQLEELQNGIKLHQIFSSFQKSMKQVDRTWIPKGRIEQVVRACCDQRYQEQDIERIFYEYGDINGLLVLHLGTRSQNALFAQMYALPVELRQELAKRCRETEISPLVKTWIQCYEKSRGTFPYSYHRSR